MNVDTEPKNRLIVYVDGFNLYNGLRDAYKKRFLWLDLVKLAHELRPKSEIVRVKYFTSPVEGRAETIKRQKHYQFALTTKHRSKLQVIQGRHEAREVECFDCGSVWDHFEEKETDVNIAVNIVQDAYTKAAEDFLIISGDTDLAPAITMARSVHKSMFVAAAFPPERFSKMLNELMPASFTINENKLRSSQLPDSFLDGLTGKKYERPPGWK